VSLPRELLDDLADMPRQMEHALRQWLAGKIASAGWGGRPGRAEWLLIQALTRAGRPA
jgi:hypothetical protein